MKPSHHKDAAFSHLLHQVMDSTSHAAELANEVVDDRNEQLVALQRRFAIQAANGFEPGQLIRWKAGMRNRRFPHYGEAAIVMEVLQPPVFDSCAQLFGSNLFREPLSLLVGLHDTEGDFFTVHMDGRRFERVLDAGGTP